ncbi:hypothetical protein Fot_22815 [Forsythia ovata]|uniref:Uncharacterized protein n=1 Tax=Forsythia ovata TaxID=205694 RepID=A0ABD1UYT1_9LAMI
MPVPAPVEKSNVASLAEPISVPEVAPDLPTVTANVSQKQPKAGVTSHLTDTETLADIQGHLEKNVIQEQPEHIEEEEDFTLNKGHNSKSNENIAYIESLTSLQYKFSIKSSPNIIPRIRGVRTP